MVRFLFGGSAPLGIPLLLLFLLAATPLRFATALQTLVAAGDKLVLEDAVPAGHLLTFQFHFPTSSSPVPVTVVTPKEVVASWTDAAEGITTISGAQKPVKVQVVIDNSASRFTSTEINFFFRSSPDFTHVGTDELLDPMEKKVRALGASMQRLQALQVNLRIEQKNHRSTVEDANDRVLTWSIFQVVVLLGISGFNFFFLKRFLEKKTFW